MPVITVEAGKLSKDQKRELVSKLSEVASSITHTPIDAYYVFIKENELENIGVDGQLLSERKGVK